MWPSSLKCCMSLNVATFVEGNECGPCMVVRRLTVDWAGWVIFCLVRAVFEIDFFFFSISISLNLIVKSKVTLI